MQRFKKEILSIPKEGETGSIAPSFSEDASQKRKKHSLLLGGILEEL